MQHPTHPFRPLGISPAGWAWIAAPWVASAAILLWSAHQDRVAFDQEAARILKAQHQEDQLATLLARR